MSINRTLCIMCKYRLGGHACCDYVLVYIVSLLNIGIIAVPDLYSYYLFSYQMFSSVHSVFRTERPPHIQCEW